MTQKKNDIEQNEYKLVNSKKDIKSSQSDSVKMSIYDYEDKYVRRQNQKLASYVIKIGVSLVGVLLVTCFFFIAMRVYDINEYLAIAVGVAELLLLIFIYIVPVAKLLKTEYFVVNVNSKTARQAQAHNKQLRNKIADKMIDFTAKVEGAGWYGDELIGKLAIARKTDNNKAIKELLTQIYANDVKRASRDIIVRCSVKSGLYSALSQSNKIDAALVGVINLQMIKDIVFLYGFRPSDTRLVKIFSRVLQNSLIAYGFGNVNIGNGVAKTVSGMVKGLPVLGSAISVLVDSSVQGLANGTLTAIIGYQTIKYLAYEYKLQDILDGIEITETDEELNEACQEIEKELKLANNSKLKTASC